jgi:hypothetical protein
MTSFIGSIMQRMIKNKKHISKDEYSLEIREFSSTLFYYSPKAYDFVREFFNYGLPAKSTIRSWLANSNCDPGFLLQSFQFLNGLSINFPKIKTALIMG